MTHLKSAMFQPSRTWLDEWDYANSAARQNEKILTWSEARWEEWETMHDNVVWFDTAGCLDFDFIGDINKASGGYKGDKGSFTELSEEKIKEKNEDLAGDLAGTPEFFSDEGAHDVKEIDTWYHTKKILAMTDDFEWWETEMYRDLMRDYVDMVDDCDIDCQARGSQLTLVAVLLGAVYGLVCLNALFMFIGTWRYRFRICSVYFTMFVCLFQFAVIVATGVILDS